jgi:hypothetical protein
VEGNDGERLFPDGETGCAVIRLPANLHSTAVELPEGLVGIPVWPRSAKKHISRRSMNYVKDSTGWPQVAPGKDENVRGLSADHLYLGAD